MPLTTYDELQTSMSNWLNRDDLDAFLPDFIALFETDVERELRVAPMLIRAVTVPSADENREVLPGDFLELKAIQFNSTPPVVPQYRTAAWLRAWLRTSPASPGTPQFYAIEGNHLVFEKTPNDIPLDILYYQAIPRLADDNQTNWLLTAAPDVYLYGSLIHSAPFLKDDERVAVWDTLYRRALSNLAKADSRAQASSAPVVKRVIRGIP